MAPKRSAPPPPVESSEEAASGSDTDESEEEIAHSAPVAAPRNSAPPLQMVQRPEAADDEEEEEEGNSEEEEEEEEEGEEEEEEDKAKHATPSSAPQNPPQPPPNPEESDESGEEAEEGTDDVAPQPVSSPRQEAKRNGGKQALAPSSGDKKPMVPFQRTWTKEDDVRILEAVAAHRREHGKLPQLEDLEAALAGTLDNAGHGSKDLSVKIKSLKGIYTRNIKKADLPSKDVDRRIFDLCKEAFGDRDRPANVTMRRDFGELCQMYPYLAEELKALERTHPGMFKREFSMIDDDKAHQIDQKIKKQRVSQAKLELRRVDMTKEVTKALMNLLE